MTTPTQADEGSVPYTLTPERIADAVAKGADSLLDVAVMHGIPFKVFVYVLKNNDAWREQVLEAYESAMLQRRLDLYALNQSLAADGNAQALKWLAAQAEPPELKLIRQNRKVKTAEALYPDDIREMAQQRSLTVTTDDDKPLPSLNAPKEDD